MKSFTLATTASLAALLPLCASAHDTNAQGMAEFEPKEAGQYLIWPTRTSLTLRAMVTPPPGTQTPFGPKRRHSAPVAALHSSSGTLSFHSIALPG